MLLRQLAKGARTLAAWREARGTDYRGVKLRPRPGLQQCQARPDDGLHSCKLPTSYTMHVDEASRKAPASDRQRISDGRRRQRHHLLQLLAHLRPATSAATAADAPSTSDYFKVRDDDSVDRTSFWSSSWSQDREAEPGFHLARPNPTLLAAEEDGFLEWPDPSQRRVLVPLCGKSLDVRYLAERGLAVVGVEGIADAVAELAVESDLALTPVDSPGTLAVQRAAVPAAVAGGTGVHGEVTVCVGDWFEFDAAATGSGQLFTHAFDRAALVAIPPHARPAYAAVHARVMAKGGKICLSTVVRGSKDGPPFSVTPEQVQELFAEHFEIELRGSNPHPVREDSTEHVHILTRK